MAQESVLRIVIDSRNAERNARNIANELQSIERNGNYATRSMDSMSVATRSLVGYMGGLVTIGAAVNKMDAWTGLQNRLKLVTDSQAELTTAMNDTFAIAQKTASSWDSAAMVYQRFADNADRLGISMKQTAVLTETVSKAISISGGSAASAEAALMQFGQALASGVLRGEEFNSIAEQAPGLLKAIAFGLDTNVGSLRAMAADGKITGDVLVESLSKAQPYIDDLFNKTDFTISQSFTRLSNEVTKFVGEAGAGSGAAAGLSDAISGLANNLGTIANIAVVGGVAFLTKAILSQTVAVYGSITASVARRAADTAVLQSQVQLAALEVQRTRQIAAQAISEIGLARQELNSATTRTARAAATMRLTQAEIAHRIALNQTTAAIATNTAAQNTLNASRAIGTRMLALVGGPIGLITLGVAGLAAGYMYLAGKTAEATAKLAEQGRVADQTAEDLKKLTGNDKKTAVTDLTTAFAAQNTELSKSKKAVDAVLFSIRASSVENEKARKVTEDAMNGTIGYTQAVALLNKMDISPDLYVMLKKQALQYDENAGKASNTQRALSLLGIEVKLVGNNAQNAVVKIDSNTEAINKNETAAQKAAKAQKAYADSLYDRDFDANFSKILLNAGKTEGEVKALLEAANYAREKGVEFTKEMANEALRVYKLENSVQDILDKRKDSEKEITKEKERQAKLGEKQAVIMAGSNEQTKNMLKVYQAFRNAGVDDTKARVLTAQVGREGDFLNKNLFGSHTDAANKKTNSGMISWQGSRSKSLTQYLQGQGVLDKKGNIEQTQEALNAQAKFFIQEIMTEKRYSSSKNALLGDSSSYRELEKTFGKNAIAWDYSGKNIGSEKASKNLARQDNYYNSLNKVLGGNPENALSSIKDIAKYDDDAYKARKDLLDRIDKLQSQYDTEAVARSKARDEEILQATILSQNDLIPKIKERYDAEDKIAKLQQKFDVEGHKWTEERKLQYTYETNVLRLTAEGKFSEDQKKIFEKGLKDQYEQEQGLLMLARETRIFQFEQAMYTEMELIKKRYDFELQEAARLQNPEERARRVNAASSTKKQDESDLLWNSTINYSNAVGIDTSAEQALKARQDAIDKMRENDFIKQKEHEMRSIESMRQYERDKQDLALNSMNMLLSTTSSTWSSMTSLIKDSVGEQSAVYKGMFLVQQAFAMTSATINALQAYNQVLANPWTFDPITKQTAASITLGMGMAGVGMIAAQTIAGFETGGYTGSGGRKDVAGVVHGQEYVLNAAATKRVGVGTLDAINSGKGLGGGDVVNAPITVHVSVQSNGDSSVDSQGQSKQLGQMIGNAVRTVIRQEQRQGGLLSK